MPIVRWLATVLRAGGTPQLHTWPSSAVRLAQVAAAARVDPNGGQFTVMGEPTTDARGGVVRGV